MVYKADVDDADDYDGWFSSVCAGHLNLIVAADDGTFTRVTVTRVLLPFEEGGGWVPWPEKRTKTMRMNNEEEDVFKDDEVDRLKLLV